MSQADRGSRRARRGTTGGAVLRLGLPKGSLQQTTEKLFTLAGFDLRIAARSYYPDIDDPEIECILIRAQEMARYVQQGVLDVGITGVDWTLENRARVKELVDLVAPWPNYNPVRWVLAVKEDSPIRGPADLAGRRISTEVVHLTRRYLRGHGVKAEVEFSWGATEVKPPILADAIVDVTETGSSLRAREHAAADRQPRRLPRRMEAAEDGASRDPADRRDPCCEPRGPDDERSEGQAGLGTGAAAGAGDSHRVDARGREMGGDQYRR
jgi:ATP phosphoribosyltransferase